MISKSRKWPPQTITHSIAPWIICDWWLFVVNFWKFYVKNYVLHAYIQLFPMYLHKKDLCYCLFLLKLITNWIRFGETSSLKFQSYFSLEINHIYFDFESQLHNSGLPYYTIIPCEKYSFWSNKAILPLFSMHMKNHLVAR